MINVRQGCSWRQLKPARQGREWGYCQGIARDNPMAIALVPAVLILKTFCRT